MNSAACTTKEKCAVSPYFVVYCRKTGRDQSRLGITTGVKLGNAVKRNFVPPPYPGAVPYQ